MQPDGCLCVSGAVRPRAGDEQQACEINQVVADRERENAEGQRALLPGREEVSARQRNGGEWRRQRHESIREARHQQGCDRHAEIRVRREARAGLIRVPRGEAQAERSEAAAQRDTGKTQ